MLFIPWGVVRWTYSDQIQYSFEQWLPAEGGACLHYEEFRAAQFLSQQELATKVGVSKATVAAIELGKSRPQPRMARALVLALDIAPGDIEWPIGNGKMAGTAP